MAGKAAAALQELQDMSGDLESSRDAATILANTEQARGQHVRTREGEEASFDTPSALATGIGASFILGPAGGIILGIAQGLAGREAQQNVLDEAAAQGNAYSDAIDVTRRQIMSQYSQDLSDEDRAILDDQMNRLNTAEDMIFSGSQQIRNDGAALYGTVGQDHTRWRETQETQQIAADAIERQLGKDTLNNFRTDLSAYDASTENYAAIVGRARSIYDNMAQGDVVSAMSALSQMPLAINPDAGAMTDGEFALWQGVGGWVDGWIGKLEKELAGGSGIEDDTRKEFMAEAEDLIRQADGFQVMRDARAQGRAQLFEYTPEMAAEFSAERFVPNWQPHVFKPTRGPGSDADGDTTTEPDAIETTITDEPAVSPYLDASRRYNELLRQQANEER